MVWIEQMLSRPMVERVGWTLIHSLWQGLALAVLLCLALAALRKCKANTRYVIACAALLLMVLAPCVTLFVVPVSKPPLITAIPKYTEPPKANVEPLYDPPLPAVRIIEPIETKVVSPAEIEPGPSYPFKGPSVLWKQRCKALLEPALPYAVFVWLAGVVALSLWHLGGWTQLQKLRRRMVRPIQGALSATLKELSRSLGVKLTVELVESAMVQVPTVVGWLKPVILLPASALTGLSMQQLEAILAHELAHIRRYDYLVNMLQTLVEILGFYHPAVWWISRKIRNDRENCCDDLAVSICENKLTYARALTSLEEMRSTGAQLAVAATGGNLLARIRRLLGTEYMQDKTIKRLPATVASLLIVVILLSLGFAMSSQASRLSKITEAVPKKPSVWLTILPKNPIHRLSEFRLAYRVRAAAEGKLDIRASEIEIRSADNGGRIAVIPQKIAHIEHLGDKKRFRQGSFGVIELTSQQRRLIGDLPNGQYVVTVNINGLRCSNVARLIVDSKFDPKDEPTIKLIPLPMQPGQELPLLGIRAVGPSPQDAELTNMSIAFPELIVDGIKRNVTKILWTGPVGPLQSGKIYIRILSLDNYDPPIEPGKQHKVKALVGKYESETVVIPADDVLGRQWDAATEKLSPIPPPKIALEGRVTDPNGRFAADYEIHIVGKEGARFSEHSDKKGKYRFVGVPPGEYELNCNPKGRGQPVITTRKVVLDANEPSVLDISFDKRYSIFGTIKYEDGTTPPGTDIMLICEDERGEREFMNTVYANGQGRYKLGGPFRKVTYIGIDGKRIQGEMPRLESSRTELNFVLKKNGQGRYVGYPIKEDDPEPEPTGKTLRDKLEAREFLLSLKGQAIDKTMIGRLAKLLRSEHVVLRWNAASVLAEDPNPKYYYVEEKVAALIDAVGQVQTLRERRDVEVLSGLDMTDHERTYLHYINCMARMPGAWRHLRYRTQDLYGHRELTGKTHSCVIIARAMRGDALVKDRIIEILRDPDAGMFRAWAVRAFGWIGSPADIAVLTDIAENDPLQRKQFGRVGPREELVYPVRRAAADAIRRIRKSAAITDESGWGEPREGLRCRWVRPSEPVIAGSEVTLAVEVQNNSPNPVFLEGPIWGMAPSISGGGRMVAADVKTLRGTRLATQKEIKDKFGVGVGRARYQPDEPMPGYYYFGPGGKLRLIRKEPWKLEKPGTHRMECWVERYNTPSMAWGSAGTIPCPPLVVDVVEPEASTLEKNTGWGEPREGLRCRWVRPSEPVIAGSEVTLAVEVQNNSPNPILWKCHSESSWCVPLSVSGGGPLPKFRVETLAGARQAMQKEIYEPIPGYYYFEPGGKLRLIRKESWKLEKPGTHRMECWVARYNLHASTKWGPAGRIPCSPLVLEVVAKDMTRPERPEPDEQGWGRAVEGVQVRLRANGGKWKVGEIPILKADVRNRGTRKLAARVKHFCHELIVDGVRYRYRENYWSLSAFFPGRQYNDIDLPVSEYWINKKTGKPLQLSPGKHTLQAIFTAEPFHKNVDTGILATSNTVEIEILAAKAAVEVEGKSTVLTLLTAIEDHRYIKVRDWFTHMMEEMSDREPRSFLLEQLQADDRRRRCSAALAFEILGDKRGVPLIIKELKDSSYRPIELIKPDGPKTQESRVRRDHYYAALFLGIARDKRAVPALIEATRDKHINRQAAISLGWIGDKRAIPALQTMLKDFPKQSLWAAYGLSLLGDAAGFDVLVSSTTHDTQQWWSKRHKAIEALGKLGDRRAVPYLIAALEDEHCDVQANAVRALGAIEGVPALVRQLKHEDRDVVIAAVKTLGEIKPPEQATIAAIIQAMRDGNGNIGSVAAQALAGFGSKAVPGLIEASTDEKARVRRYAVEALGKIGPQAKEAMPRLIEMYTDKYGDVRTSAANALIKIDTEGDTIIAAFQSAKQNNNNTAINSASTALVSLGQRVIPLLLDAMKDENEYLRHRAARALGKIGVANQHVVDALIDALNDEQEEVRGHAVRTLGVIRPVKPKVVDALIKACSDKSTHICFSACTALGDIGPEAQAAVPVLLELLKHEHETYRWGAARALSKIGPAEEIVPILLETLGVEESHDVSMCISGAIREIGEGAVPPITDALRDEDKRIRSAAIYVLRESQPSFAEAVVPTLIEMLNDDDEQTRAESAYALWVVGFAGKQAVPALIETLKDNSPNVRSHAAHALGWFRHPAIVPALIETLKDEDAVVRVDSIISLGEFGPAAKDAVPELIRLLEGDSSTAARREAAKTLGRIGETAALPALRKALSDKEREVRKAAAEAIRQIEEITESPNTAKRPA